MTTNGSAPNDAAKKPEKTKQPIEEKVSQSNMKKKKNYLKMFLWASVIFFVTSLLIAGLVLFRGGNIISSDNVEIDVSGPLSINGGEPVKLQISVKNNNSADIELSDLIIEFPEGTRSVENINLELPRIRKTLGPIESREVARETIEALLFGEEGDIKELKITVEYRIENSNAIFVKEDKYEIEISSSPINISVGSLKEITSGREVDVNLEISSNSPTIVEDLVVQVDYPFGFTFKNSSPSPVSSNNIWRVGNISPGGKKTISFSGTLEGQDNEERVFRVFTGIESEEGIDKFETAFSSVKHSILITKPFISIDLEINNESGPHYTAAPNEEIGATITWKNNLPDPVSNVEIEAKIDGSILDESSVEVVKGFYRSIDNTVIWDKNDEPDLSLLNPGQSGTVSFTFKPKNQSADSIVNPEVSVSVSARGRRISDSQVSEEIKALSSTSIRFTSLAVLLGETTYSKGPITNSGPIPPQVEVPTTYTVTWSLSNSSNDIVDGEVRATLPSYVSWTGNISPQAGANLTFNSSQREVLWRPGKIEAGTGLLSSPKEASFQIRFLPSVSQVGSEPILVNQSEFTGEDDFTGATIRATKRAMTTRISTDPSYTNGDERVVE